MKIIRTLVFALIITIVVSCKERKQFDSTKWKKWKESENSPSLRWEMHESLLKDYKLNMYSKKQIIDLLGNPNSKNENEFQYFLGYSNRGVNTGIMIVKFKNDTVESTEIISE
jgi:hypothetical protein